MEKYELTEEQEQSIKKHLIEKRKIGIVFMIIGIVGLIPVGVHLFGGADTGVFSSPTFIFFILGIIFYSQYEESIKGLNNKEYQAYTAICKKVSSIGYLSVDNNETLSKVVRNPLKRIDFLGSHKLYQVGYKVGILQVKKTFWALSLNGNENMR